MYTYVQHRYELICTIIDIDAEITSYRTANRVASYQPSAFLTCITPRSWRADTMA